MNINDYVNYAVVDGPIDNILFFILTVFGFGVGGCLWNIIDEPDGIHIRRVYTYLGVSILGVIVSGLFFLSYNYQEERKVEAGNLSNDTKFISAIESEYGYTTDASYTEILPAMIQPNSAGATIVLEKDGQKFPANAVIEGDEIKIYLIDERIIEDR